MKTDLPTLPVSEAVPALMAALDTDRAAVLAAPPGAGKTTLVPLHLLAANWLGDGKILVLEPRRLAARASARQMARLLREEVGRTVGYRTRLDAKISAATRIEVITEGIFARMIVDNPELPGVAAVLFDEFHERTLDADFGLALALDVQSALRDDLRLLVMSATLDVARVSKLLGEAPVIESKGRAFPVDIRYRERPAGEKIEFTMAAAIRQALREETGSILAFLPGQREIRRTAELLEDGDTGGATIAPLFGDLSGAAQDAAIRPPQPGTRKIVLATAIAETSITIDGVRIVIDSGLQRLPVFEPATGITRLDTVRVSRASADQRAGRAGRTEPGIAIRLWRAEQTAALPAFTPPQILASDLTGLILDCAAWGVGDPGSLALPDAPPAAALQEARALLATLGALDDAGRLTAAGRKMRGLGLPVRLAAMVIAADGNAVDDAAELAVLMGEQGLGGPSVDLDARWRRFREDRSRRARDARALARRIAHKAGGGPDPATGGAAPAAGPLLLPGFKDRVAKRRAEQADDTCRFVLANGRGAYVDKSDPLARETYLVVADLTGRATAQRILAAAAIDASVLHRGIVDDTVETLEIGFDRKSRSIRARQVRRLGSLVLEEKPLAEPPAGDLDAALVSGLEMLGIDALPWTKPARQLRSRMGWLFRENGPPFPDVRDAALLATADRWFLPFQSGVTRFDRIEPQSLGHGLASLLPHELQRDLDRLAPTHFATPAGSSLPIDYDGDEPVLKVRVQELYGLTQHPRLAGGKVPLVLELLSPAQRPIQKTRDLPGFWAGSWADVRAEMRGRYPKHPWPEDPAAADPTTRVKHPRKR